MSHAGRCDILRMVEVPFFSDAQMCYGVYDFISWSWGGRLEALKGVVERMRLSNSRCE
jgi:hypothetical protein